MDLPKNDVTFNFKEQGATTGEEYVGEFTVISMMNVAQRYELELEKSRLIADFNNPTDGLTGIAEILSTLRTRIVDGPKWWRDSAGGFNIMDENILVSLYNRVLKAEDSWRDKLAAKGREAKEANEKEQQKKTTELTNPTK